MQTKRRGLGAIEIVIILAVLVIIGALVFVALKPKDKPQASVTPNTQEIHSTQDVQAAVKEVEQQDLNAVDAELDSLTKDIGNL